jgi:hypothetical protein
MKLQLQPARDGALKALKTTLTLAKIIIPVTMAVVALDQMNLMVVIAQWFNPLARLFGLPGEAALVLLLGFLVGIYAAIGAIVLLPLSTGDITVLAVMILTSHSLPMEGSVLNFTGLSPLKSTCIRLSAAMLFGFLVNIIYSWWGG